MCVCKLKIVYSVDSPNGWKVGSIPTVGANLNQNVMSNLSRKIIASCALILLLGACALIAKAEWGRALVLVVPAIVGLLVADGKKQIK